jgi:hypothetical protein
VNCGFFCIYYSRVVCVLVCCVWDLHGVCILCCFLCVFLPFLIIFYLLSALCQSKCVAKYLCFVCVYGMVLRWVVVSLCIKILFHFLFLVSVILEAEISSHYVCHTVTNQECKPNLPICTKMGGGGIMLSFHMTFKIVAFAVMIIRNVS